MGVNEIVHIGWITYDREKFESFWCDILDFEIIKEAEVTTELTEHLFGIKGGATVVKYAKDPNLEIEIHIFDSSEKLFHQSFDRIGINHVCFNVPDRAKFINKLPSNVDARIYENPLGWTNTFIRDFEGNWIEIRD